jgi:hypothetical protein
MTPSCRWGAGLDTGPVTKTYAEYGCPKLQKVGTSTSRILLRNFRDELRSMEAANATPEQFGLKVRSHPDTLIVTARNKMGSGEKLRVAIGLSKRFVRDGNTALGSRNTYSQSISGKKVGRASYSFRQSSCRVRIKNGGFFVSGVPVGVVDSFLLEFRNHRGSLVTESEPIRRYIQERSASELKTWDILFASLGKEGSNGLVDTSLGITINCLRRAPGSKSQPGITLFVTSKQRVASRGVEKAGLTPAEIDEAERNYRRTANDGNGSTPNYPDLIYRSVRQRPLLIVHLLAIGTKDENLGNLDPVVAWSISFPATHTDEKLIEYVVNPTWLRENYRDDLEDLDEEEMAGDDN